MSINPGSAPAALATVNECAAIQVIVITAQLENVDRRLRNMAYLQESRVNLHRVLS
jgi:hypothetical protein